MKQLLTLALGVVIGASSFYFGSAFLGQHSADQPYAGQQTRVISSLSPKDINQLENGKGWGLAKPAEFNGYPGPSHVLEFQEELKLSVEQRTSIQNAFEAMSEKAKVLGVELIESEAALDQAFKSGAIDEMQLVKTLQLAESARSKLRAVHLTAHLEVTPLLSDEQKKQYAQLRGYGGSHSAHTGH